MTKNWNGFFATNFTVKCPKFLSAHQIPLFFFICTRVFLRIIFQTKNTYHRKSKLAVQVTNWHKLCFLADALIVQRSLTWDTIDGYMTGYCFVHFSEGQLRLVACGALSFEGENVSFLGKKYQFLSYKEFFFQFSSKESPAVLWVLKAKFTDSRVLFEFFRHWVFLKVNKKSLQ